jgi:hypothetical protein
VRVSEGLENWCAEIIPGALDKSPPPRGLLARWSHLLQEITTNPQGRLGEFSLLQEDEQRALSEFNSVARIDPKFVEMVRVFQRGGCQSVVAIRTDNAVLDAAMTDFAGPDTLQDSRARHFRVLAANSDRLRSLAKGCPLKQIIPDLERVIVPAQSPCDFEFFARDPGMRLSAFVALDERADLFLWTDQFQPGLTLAGRPCGGDPVVVLDEWDNLAPIGIKGRIFKKTSVDGSDLEMISLHWSGRWRADGLLEISARQFDTIELDAEEMEELLR